MPLPQWVRAPVEPDPPGNAIHIYQFPLSISAELEERFLATLSPDETAKLTQAHLPALRHRQIAARGYLRCILARYLRLPPDEIEFSYGVHGKPALSAKLAIKLNPALHFNMTHVEIGRAHV